MVQLAAHGAQAGFDVMETLSIGQLSKGHRQILAAAGEAPTVHISAVALDTLLELVGGQVIHELGEDSLSGIHPSLSAIRSGRGHLALAPGSAAINFKSKNASYTLSHVICDRYSERPILAGHYWNNSDNDVILCKHRAATVFSQTSFMEARNGAI